MSSDHHDTNGRWGYGDGAEVKMSEGQWLVPFKGRNDSLATTQNFLWQSGNVYIMDNHRAAMWCWLQQVPSDERVILVHVDEHFDTLYSQIVVWLSHLPDLRDLSIDNYLELTYPLGNQSIPLIRWDNYLSLFLERYPQQLTEAIFITHGVGDEPRFTPMRHILSKDVPSNLAFHLKDHVRAIVNIDLDYFFCDNERDQRQVMFSEEYISAVFRVIRAHMDAGRVACLTLCMTPDEAYTGGWAQAEKLCERVCEILGIDFALPADAPGAQ